jgi:hypothetical protein
VRPPGFSLYRGYRNLLAERIHVRILGHAGQIPRSYLHDLCDHDIQAFYRDERGLITKIYHEPCLVVSMPKIVELSSSTSRKSLPMGVNCRFYYLVFVIDDEVDFVLL